MEERQSLMFLLDACLVDTMALNQRTLSLTITGIMVDLITMMSLTNIPTGQEDFQVSSCSLTQQGDFLGCSYTFT